MVGNRDQHDVNGSGTTRIRFGRVAYNNPQHITVLAGINKLITLITIAAYIAAALTVLDRHSATLANRSVAVAVASIIAVASSCPIAYFAARAAWRSWAARRGAPAAPPRITGTGDVALQEQVAT